jgi:hypothetical protein
VADTYAFYRQWLPAPLPAPGQAPPTLEERLGALAATHVGWVLYDAQADPTGALLGQLQALLGPPASEDKLAAAFKLPAEPAPDLLWGLGGGWEAPSEANAPQSFCQRGLVYIFVSSPRAGQLSFAAQPGAAPAHFSVRFGGQIASRFTAEDAAQFSTGDMTLSQGFNRIEFTDEEIPAGPAAATPQPCQAADHAVPWGPAISALRFEQNAAAPLATFGEALQLTAAAAPDHAQPGQAVSVHVAWRAATAPLEDLTVFVHLNGPQGELMAQNDSPPLEGQYPTAKWALGESVAYAMTVTLPADLPSGQYQWVVGVYPSASQAPLPVSGAEAVDNAVPVGPLTITSP